MQTDDIQTMEVKMVGEVIREDTDRERWMSLMAVWERDKRPGFVVVGKVTYRVLQLEGDIVEFRNDRSTKDYYEHTSF